MKIENCVLQIDVGIIGKLQLEEFILVVLNDEYINQVCCFIDNQDVCECFIYMVEEVDIEKIFFEICLVEVEWCVQKILEMVLYYELDIIKFV